MKLETCYFSGAKIYPGNGSRIVRVDGKTHTFQSSKMERSYKLHKNPRETRWTVLYRRKNKKNKEDETTKKRTHRRVAPVYRAVVGASLTEILAKRNQKPDVRKAQRDEAIKAAKAKLKAQKDSKKATQVKQSKGKGAKKQQKMQEKAMKKMPKGAAKSTASRTR